MGVGVGAILVVALGVGLAVILFWTILVFGVEVAVWKILGEILIVGVGVRVESILVRAILVAILVELI